VGWGEPQPIVDIDVLKGVCKSPNDPFIDKFDLSYVYRRYHLIFLYFLRQNSAIESLIARGVNLKGELIKSSLKDFVNLRELFLSFTTAERKKRELSSLIRQILQNWQQIKFVLLENFQVNLALFDEFDLHKRLGGSNLKHIIVNDVYIFTTKLYTPVNPQLKQPQSQQKL